MGGQEGSDHRVLGVSKEGKEWVVELNCHVGVSRPHDPPIWVASHLASICSHIDPGAERVS
jgi:hypothetical protein